MKYTQNSEIYDFTPEDENLFYEPDYIPTAAGNSEDHIDLTNPKAIFRYLKKHIYKQDRYCREASIILFNHIRGITSRTIVCGPSGCGKTLVWQTLKKVFSRIIFVDASTLTKTGWKGNNNIASFLNRIDSKRPEYIVVFDEFDKCVAPQYSSGENVSASIQSEFLKLVEGMETAVKTDSAERIIDTSKISFVFCGSFAKKAEQISKKNSSSGFGFGAEKHEVKMFDEELDIQDLISFGLIPELASRVGSVINIRPLCLEDYRYLITEHPASPVNELEKTYGMKLNLDSETIDRIAKEAYESGLGIRNVSSRIQQIFNERLFDSFDEPEEE